MSRIFGIFAVIICMTVGCARKPTFIVTVDALSDPQAQPVYNYYVILPGEKGLSSDDLRFKEFCVYIDRALASKGFAKASSPEEADFVVLLSYAISAPKEHVYSYSVPHFGQTGVSSSTTYGTMQSSGNYGTYSGTTTHQPTYGITGYSSHIDTYVTYTRTVRLIACDLDTYKREKKVKELWRVLATSTGNSGDLRLVFPILIAAAQPYIGESTDKKSISIELREDDDKVIRIRDGEAALEAKRKK